MAKIINIIKGIFVKKVVVTRDPVVSFSDAEMASYHRMMASQRTDGQW
jgi:hypothetical protein